MPNKSLIAYIQQQLNNGFDINTIRNHLIKHGYSFKQVDDVIDHLYRHKETKHTIHLSRSSALVLIFLFIGISLVIASIFIYMAPGEKKEYLLDLEISPTTTSVEPGQLLEFDIQLFNIGYKEKFDVHLTHEITSVETGAIIISLEEEIGVITRASKTSRIRIPLKTELGNYKLGTIADYKQKTASASFVFSVFKEALETCSDNIQNQDEEGIDCGGICLKCEEEKKEEEDEKEDKKEEEKICPGSCDDNDPCTLDYCDGSTNFKCDYTRIELCCGNNICESLEDPDSCPADCTVEEEEKRIQTLEEILEIAQTDQHRATSLCEELEGESERDLCFSNVAISTNNDGLCAKIKETIKKDSCIMNIAINTDDYSNCYLISNSQLRNSCNLLAE